MTPRCGGHPQMGIGGDSLTRLLAILLIVGCMLPSLAQASERGDRTGPYTYLYIADWSKLRHQAAQGDPESLFRIGNLYYLPPDNSGIPQNYKKSFLAFYEAALRQHFTAQHNVGAMFINGDYVAQDIVEGYAWMLVSAKNGDAAGKRKTKEFANELSDEAKQKAKLRSDEILAMIEEANRRKDFRPDRYGVR